MSLRIILVPLILFLTVFQAEISLASNNTGAGGFVADYNIRNDVDKDKFPEGSLFGRIHSNGKGQFLFCNWHDIRLEDYVSHKAFMQGYCAAKAPTISTHIMQAKYLREDLFLASQNEKEDGQAPPGPLLALLGKTWPFTGAKPRNDLKQLPDRIIDGHSCRGWTKGFNAYPSGKVSESSWFDKDTGCLVKSENSTSLTGMRVITLLRYQKEELPGAAFVLPIKDKKIWNLLVVEEQVQGHQQTKTKP